MTTMTSLMATPFHDAYLAQLLGGKKSTSGLLQRTSPRQGLAGETLGLARQEAQVALTELARRLENPRLLEDPTPTGRIPRCAGLDISRSRSTGFASRRSARRAFSAGARTASRR